MLGRASSRRIVAAAGTVGLAAVCVVVGVLLRARGLQDAANAAQLMSIPLAVAPLTVELVVWSRRPLPAVAAGADQLGQARTLLAGLVETQWRAEERIRALGDPHPIPVRWALTEQPVADHPRLIAPDGLVLSGRSDRIGELVDQFRSLPRQRLVILGGPGAGKTTLAIQLLLCLLRNRIATDPVPVLLTLAGWNLHTHPRLQDWLAARLAEDYPALRAIDSAIPRALVDQGMVMPVLDGLDELPSSYQPLVIAALNASLAATDPVVVTSRTIDFAAAVEAGDVLTAAAVIEPEPLTTTDAADYLASCLPPNPGQPWAQILQSLRDDAAGPLTGVCATPLGLWLLRTVYINTRRDPRSLITDSTRYPDAAAIEEHLLDDLIPAVVTARPPSSDPADLLQPRHRWDPADVRRWLSYLAGHLQGDRDVLWWHVARRTLRSRSVGLIAGLTVVLVIMLMDGLLRVLQGWRLDGLLNVLAVQVVLGTAFGLVIGRVVMNGFATEPGYANFRLRGRVALTHSVRTNLVAGLMKGLVLALAFGLLIGLACGVLGGLRAESVLGLTFNLAAISAGLRGLLAGILGLIAGLIIGLPFALVGGLVGGLVGWAEAPTTIDHAGTPISTHHADRTLFIMRAVLGGLIGWLLFELLYWLMNGVGLGLFTGMLLGLVCGLVAGGSRAWLCFTVAARWLALTGRLPWRLLGFLDDAYRLGLLRMAGPAYQFRHAKLQDHLATKKRSQPYELVTQ